MERERFLSHPEAADLNRNRILYYIRANEPVSRTDIWENNSISRASVTHIVNQLISQGLVLESEKGESKGGRKPSFLTFNPNSKHMYVYSWLEQSLMLTNPLGDTLFRVPINLETPCEPSQFVHAVSDGINEINRHYKIDASSILGLGLIMPGANDSRECVVLYSTELGWREINLRFLFEGIIDYPIFLERISNMIALGQYDFIKQRESTHIMSVLFSKNGIGASMVLRGDCYHGSNYLYGELGHTKFNSNVICSCGRKGCLEAILKDIMKKNGGVIDCEVIDYLSLAIASAVNLFDPDVVILCGDRFNSFSKADLDLLCTKISNNVLNEKSRKLSIEVDNDYQSLCVKGMCSHIFAESFNTI